MTLSEAAGIVTATQSYKLIRPCKAQAEGAPIQYDVKPYEGAKRGWVLLDGMTAQAVTLVYNALDQARREKFDRMSADRALSVVWKCVK